MGNSQKASDLHWLHPSLQPPGMPHTSLPTRLRSPAASALTSDTSSPLQDRVIQCPLSCCSALTPHPRVHLRAWKYSPGKVKEPGKSSFLAGGRAGGVCGRRGSSGMHRRTKGNKWSLLGEQLPIKTHSVVHYAFHPHSTTK